MEFLNINNGLRGLIGIISIIGICYLLSSNRKKISWKLVITGLLIQLIFAIGVLKIAIVSSFFNSVSNVFIELLEFTKSGAIFLFGETLVNDNSFGATFAFQILPTIVFFSSLTSVLFYLGILQKIVYFFARIIKKMLNLSGAESLAAVGNIFLGQTESPLLIKPYIQRFTNSELLCLMGGCLSNPYGVVKANMGFNLLLANLDWVHIESPHHRVFAPIFQATKACLRTSVNLLQND